MAFASVYEAEKVISPALRWTVTCPELIDGIRNQLGEGVAKTKTEGLGSGAVVRI